MPISFKGLQRIEKELQNILSDDNWERYSVVLGKEKEVLTSKAELQLYDELQTLVGSNIKLADTFLKEINKTW